jgi:hypothetical protein
MSSRMLISFQQTLPVKYFKAFPRLKLEPPVVCYNTDYFIQPYVSLVLSSPTNLSTTSECPEHDNGCFLVQLPLIIIIRILRRLIITDNNSLL